jgi:tetratricopeptide (TPR) repeat protein
MGWRSFLPVVLLTAAAARAEAVLVLPFFNLSQTSRLDWIGESIAEALRESLSASGILTLSRDDRQEALRRLAIRPYARLTRASVVKAAETLDASQVVYGQFELRGGEPDQDPAKDPAKATLHVTARVIDLRRIQQSAELSDLGALEDLAPIETHLSWQVLKTLSPETFPTEEEFRKSRPAIRLDAVENYVRGLLAAAPEQKLRHFAQAARLDARFSPPCFELGRLYSERKEHRFAIEWLERVARGDSRYFEAQFLLGLARYQTSDFARAEAAFHVVAGSVPLNEVLNNLAAAQSRRNAPEAVENFSKALDGDSADPDYHFNLAYALWKRGSFEKAADSFRAALDRKPDDSEATLFLGRCLKKTGPRPGDPRSEGLERVKHTYEESAYRQLKAAVETKPAVETKR